MERQHQDLPVTSFKRLNFGQLPEGKLKFCSNWERMWDAGFEPEDNKLKKGNFFKLSNKDAKKRQSKLIFHHCGMLGKRSLKNGDNGSEVYQMFKPKLDNGDLNEE